MIENEIIRRRRCDLCRGEIERLSQKESNSTIGQFLPVEWGQNKVRLNLRLTIGNAPDGGGQGPGAEEHRPDVCRRCLREVFTFMAKKLDGGGPGRGSAVVRVTTDARMRALEREAATDPAAAERLLRARQRVSLALRPISRNAAMPWIKEHHRHLKRAVKGWLFGVEVLLSGDRVGVACAGRPARMLQYGVTCEITRVCTNGARNACSFAYGRLRAAAKALGYTRVVTYTRLDEDGTTCRAAGFRDDGPAGGGEADRPSRRRTPVEDPSPKRRWVWTTEAHPSHPKPAGLVRLAVRGRGAP